MGQMQNYMQLPVAVEILSLIADVKWERGSDYSILWKIQLTEKWYMSEIELLVFIQSI